MPYECVRLPHDRPHAAGSNSYDDLIWLGSPLQRNGEDVNRKISVQAGGGETRCGRVNIKTRKFSSRRKTLYGGRGVGAVLRPRLRSRLQPASHRKYAQAAVVVVGRWSSIVAAGCAEAVVEIDLRSDWLPVKLIGRRHTLRSDEVMVGR